MVSMNRRVEQADLADVASGLRDVVAQFDRVVNRPVVDGGTLSLSRVEALLQDMNTSIASQLSALRTKLDSLECRVKVTDANAIARTYNRRVVKDKDELFTLLSVHTGHDIVDFPRTLGDALDLPGRDVDRILHDLGGGGGLGLTLRERRRRLLIGFGVDPDAVR